MTANTAQTYPFPRGYAAGFDAESGFVDWLSETLERFGWRCEAEVPSADSTSRADILAEHDHWGVLGIECKYKERIRPRNWATALKQAQRYEGKTYRGEYVKNWALAVGQREHLKGAECSDDYFDARGESGQQFREFMNTMGVGVFRMDTRLEIVFNNSNPMVKAPVASVQYPSGELRAPEAARFEECVNQEARSYLD